MKGIFWTLALFCASATYALPTSSKCSDAQYACRNLFIAHECRTVKSCIQTVWEKLPTPKEDNNEICDICKEMVKEARDTLLSNETQEELREVFEGSCNLIPIKFIANACKKLADDYIPDLVDALASRMDPTQVCSVAGLCLPTQLQSLIAEVLGKQPVQTQLQPDVEESIAQEIGTITNEANLDSLVTKMCQSKFPVSVDLCRSMIHQYLPMVQNYVKTLRMIRGVGDNMTCEFCESVLQYVKNMITSETTEEELKTALANFCNDLGQLAQECKQFVDQYFDEVFNYIKNLDVHNVCTMLGLCEGSAEPLLSLQPSLNDVLPLAKRLKHPPQPSEMPMLKLLPARRIGEAVAPMLKLEPAAMPMLKLFPAEPASRKNKYERFIEVAAETNSVNEKAQQLPLARLMNPIIPLFNDMDCVVCKAMTYFLETEMADGILSEEQTLETLDRISETWLKELADQAREFLSRHSAQVVAHLMQGKSPRTLCRSLNVCAAEDKGREVAVKIVPPAKASPKNVTCELCKKVIEILDSELETNRTKEAVREALDKVCSYLPQALVEECRDFVDTYAEDLVTFLVNQLDPDVVCQKFMLCAARRLVRVNIRGDTECNICKEVISFIDDELQDNRTVAAIKEVLDKVCSLLPQQLADKCNSLVNQYTDELIDLLTRQVDPETLCVIFQQCPGNFVRPEKKKQNDIDCELCKQVIGVLQEELKDNRTEEAIKEALEQVCSLLPQAMSDQCKAFVDKYTPVLLTLLAESVDPTQICTMLGLCQNSKGSPGCALCNYVLHYLQDVLTRNSTQAEIKREVEKVCLKIPSALKEDCEGFIEEYGSAVIALLTYAIDPSVVCVYLRICPGMKPVAIEPVHVDECQLCENMVDIIDKLLENDKVDQEIVHLVEKVCSLVPSASRNQCISSIETYGAYILQMIGELATSKQVCQAIDMCPRTAGHVHLLGGRKCTYGPSYWCKSPAHAASCKADSYCKEKVWKN